MTHVGERSGTDEPPRTARKTTKATTNDPCGVGDRHAEARERPAALAAPDRSRNAVQVVGIPRLARAAPATSDRVEKGFGRRRPRTGRSVCCSPRNL